MTTQLWGVICTPPAWLGVTADAEIWNRDAGGFLKGWKCNMQKGDLAGQNDGWDLEREDLHEWNVCIISVCIAAGGTVPSLSLCLHQIFGV